MESFSVLISSSSGIKIPSMDIGTPKISLLKDKFSPSAFCKLRSGFNELIGNRASSKRSRFFLHLFHSKTSIVAAGRDPQLTFNDDSDMEPFWVNPIREAIWAVRTLFMFLYEQPGQLRYIEWPSFKGTLKTAMLTLVLVAFLIVALASVDSALAYLLAFTLRRKA